jgi:hypothetical protein
VIIRNSENQELMRIVDETIHHYFPETKKCLSCGRMIPPTDDLHKIVCEQTRKKL